MHAVYSLGKLHVNTKYLNSVRFSNVEREKERDEDIEHFLGKISNNNNINSS